MSAGCDFGGEVFHRWLVAMWASDIGIPHLQQDIVVTTIEPHRGRWVLPHPAEVNPSHGR
jgi:hypothetical protein